MDETIHVEPGQEVEIVADESTHEEAPTEVAPIETSPEETTPEVEAATEQVT